jgi:serine/threonine protein kinase
MKEELSAELMVVWSLGVTLYAMLSAELPFESESSEQRRARIINCKWVAQSCFSSKVTKLISSMLVQSSWRASLAELQSSELLLNYEFKSAEFIDWNTETILPSEAVLTSL